MVTLSKYGLYRDSIHELDCSCLDRWTRFCVGEVCSEYRGVPCQSFDTGDLSGLMYNTICLDHASG